MADPSCPYCHVAAGKNGELNKQVGDRFTLIADGGSYIAPVPEMKKLVDAGRAAFAYVYTNGHGNGEMGTKALYCAYEKGKFWEVHDLLMTSAGYAAINNSIKNDKTKSGELADFLKSVFNAGQMKQCLDSGKYDARIAEDSKLAAGVGVRGTPGFLSMLQTLPARTAGTIWRLQWQMHSGKQFFLQFFGRVFPRCLYACAVAIRPRGVRFRNPICII